MKVFIGHTDTLLNFKNDNYDFKLSNKNTHIDLPRLKKGNVRLQVYAVFVEPELKPYLALEKTLGYIDTYYSLIDENEELNKVLQYEDIIYSLENDKIASILALEGAGAVYNVSTLRILYRLGVRIISLTWNQRNQLADGIEEEITSTGLTTLGRLIIEEMDRLGIIIDVSHLSTKSFWDVMQTTNKPVIATHSNAKSICTHPRNLNNKQIKAIADSGGLIGINFAPLFLTKNKKTEIKDVIKHIDYIKGLVGVEHITLGTDYDGISTAPEGLEDVSKLPLLEDALYKYGYTEEQIKKIFYENYLNFFRNYWG